LNHPVECRGEIVYLSADKTFFFLQPQRI